VKHIDHSNYEAWLLDRLEGNLTPEQERMLEAFLLANPGLDPGDGRELPTLDGLDAMLSRADKEALKRSLPPAGLPGEAPIDDLLIARLEGDLTPEQTETLRQYLIDHPEHQRAERLYALTKLVPEAMAYAAKKELERQLPPQGLPTRHTLEDFLVARLEGDLTAEQGEALRQYLVDHPEDQRTERLYALARVAPEAVVFPAKQDLKKGGRVIAITATRATWMMRLRVAAMVTVLLGAGMWALNRKDGADGRIAANGGKEPGATVQATPEARTGDASPREVRAASPETGTDGAGQRPTKTRATGADASLADRAGTGPKRTEGEERARPVRTEHEAPMLAQGRSLLPSTREPERVPVGRPMPEAAGIRPWEESPEEPLLASAEGGMPLGGLLAGELRKRVLGQQEEDTRPLDRGDATAALDKGLRTVGGENVGLSVDRDANGRARAFDLRLGRNLTISASR